MLLTTKKTWTKVLSWFSHTDVQTYLSGLSNNDKKRLDENTVFLKKLARLESITWLQPEDDAPLSATQLVGEMKVLVPMAGFIDKDKEIQRLNKEIDKIKKDQQRIAGKLSNEKFVANAPADVVAKEKNKLEVFDSAIANLAEQLEKLKTL